jgi:hypothetical protein
MRGMDDERRSRTAKGEIGGARENARVSGSVRNAGERASSRVPDARTRRPARASSAEHESCLDRAPVRIDRRFDRADAVADRKRATDGGRCDRRTPPRVSERARGERETRRVSDAGNVPWRLRGDCLAIATDGARLARGSRVRRRRRGPRDESRVRPTAFGRSAMGRALSEICD